MDVYIDPISFIAIQGVTRSCSQLNHISHTEAERETVKISSTTEFFYHDPTVPDAPLSDHELAQSPCYPTIAVKQGYVYCGLHPDVQSVHLESIRAAYEIQGAGFA